MTDMTGEEYITQRLEAQQKWYSKNSGTNKIWYRCLQVMQLLFATSIPFLAIVVSDLKTLSIATGALGGFIALTTGFSSAFKFEEKWTKYRNTGEALKHEKFMFLTRVGPYDGVDASKTLVQRVEHLISQEHSDWMQYINASGEPKDKQPKP